MMKLSSLQSRVVMLAAGTATLAVLISAYLFDRSTRLEFRTFLNSREPSAAALAIPARLEEWYRHAGSWNGVRETLEDLERAWDHQILLLDGGGRVMAAAPRELERAAILPNGDHLRIELGRGGPRGGVNLIDVRGAGTLLRDAAGADAGRVYILPPFRAHGDRPPRFLVSLRRSLILAAILAIL